MATLFEQPESANLLGNILKSIIETKPEEVPRYGGYSGAPDYFVQSDPFLDPQLLVGVLKAVTAIPLALTKHEFGKQVTKFLGKQEGEISKRGGRKLISGIGGVKDTKSIPRAERGWEDEKGIKAALQSKYEPRTYSKKSTMYLTKKGDPYSAGHELGEEMFFLVNKRDKELAEKVFHKFDKSNPESIKMLENYFDSPIYTTRELFSHGYSAYLHNDPIFKDLPIFLQYLIKKYHKLSN